MFTLGCPQAGAARFEAPAVWLRDDAKRDPAVDPCAGDLLACIRRAVVDEDELRVERAVGDGSDEAVERRGEMSLLVENGHHDAERVACDHAAAMLSRAGNQLLWVLET